jgi:hypothetical protein
MYQSTILGTSLRPRAPPNAEPFHCRPGDELERPRRDLGAGGGDADDDRLPPALVAALERLAHRLRVADALEAVSAPPSVRRAISSTTFATSFG